MQLTINFPESEIQKAPTDNHCEDSYIKEFEQWNFSHVLRQTKYSAKEILHLFLANTNSRDDLKVLLLKKLGRDVNYLEWEMNEEYKEYIRKHNDGVRIKIWSFYKKEVPADLKKRWLNKLWKYNDFYRKLYGGKSFNNMLVTDTDHEWHDRYLTKKKEHIQRCISHLTISYIRNPAGILNYYIALFGAQEIIDAVKDMKLAEDKKNIILKHIDDFEKEQEKK